MLGLDPQYFRKPGGGSTAVCTDRSERLMKMKGLGHAEPMHETSGVNRTGMRVQTSYLHHTLIVSEIRMTCCLRLVGDAGDRKARQGDGGAE